MPGVGDIPYDEFSLFSENLSEWGLDVPVPHVRRFFVAVDGLRQLSGLRWGDAAPELALIHGGAQNAHTYDTVALALQRPLIALDLPGHGHSDARPFGSSAVAGHARGRGTGPRAAARPARARSWGCPSAAWSRSSSRTSVADLVSALVLIDITPGVTATKARHITRLRERARPASTTSTRCSPARSSTTRRARCRHCAAASCTTPSNARTARGCGATSSTRAATLEAPDVGDLWARLVS